MVHVRLILFHLIFSLSDKLFWENNHFHKTWLKVLRVEQPIRIVSFQEFLRCISSVSGSLFWELPRKTWLKRHGIKNTIVTYSFWSLPNWFFCLLDICRFQSIPLTENLYFFQVSLVWLQKSKLNGVCLMQIS